MRHRIVENAFPRILKRFHPEAGAPGISSSVCGNGTGKTGGIGGQIFEKKNEKNRCYGIGDFTIQFAVLSNLSSIFSIQFSLENLRRPSEHSFDKFLLFRALHRDLARI